MLLYSPIRADAADGAAGLAAGVAGEECEVPLLRLVALVVDHVLHIRGAHGLAVGDDVAVDDALDIGKRDLGADLDELDGAEMAGEIVAADDQIICIVISLVAAGAVLEAIHVPVVHDGQLQLQRRDGERADIIPAVDLLRGLPPRYAGVLRVSHDAYG